MILCNINWEKIPDWIQAIGAVIAAIGLVITLLLQRKTLKEQQIITQLEQKKFLDSYLPILELANIKYSKNEQIRDTAFDVIIRENYLRNLKISHNFPTEFRIDIPYYISDVILPKGYIFHFNIHTVLSAVFVEMAEYIGNTIIFDFEDALGNKYKQYLIFKGSTNVFMQPAFRNHLNS